MQADVLLKKTSIVFLALLIQACGGGGGTPNTAPVLQNIPDKELLENSDERVALTSASDAESDLLSLSLSGPDAGQFEFRANGILVYFIARL